MNDFPRAVDHLLDSSSAIKRIPHPTPLIANLILRFLWNVCRAHFLTFVLTEMVFLSMGGIIFPMT
jgi:hypothetical protein